MEGGSPESIANRAGQIARLPDPAAPDVETNGSRAGRRYNVSGARGEARAGFPRVVAAGPACATPIALERRNRDACATQRFIGDHGRSGRHLPAAQRRFGCTECRQLLGPFGRLESPWLMMQGVVPQADDGVIVARGTIAGKPSAVLIVISSRLGSHKRILPAGRNGRISDLLKILLAYFTFSWKKELHVVAGDLSGTNDIAGSTRMVAWVDRGA